MVFSGPVPFVPVETSGLTSDGAIKVPDAIPSSSASPGCSCRPRWMPDGQLESAFPAALRPMVSLVAYAGNLGMNSGPSQSVYSLNTAGLRRLPVAPRPLAIGQSMKLPNGLGTLTYTGYRQWISLAITYDPGQLPALISGIAVLGGLLLSFLVRRRRVFVRASGRPGGRDRRRRRRAHPLRRGGRLRGRVRQPGRRAQEPAPGRSRGPSARGRDVHRPP